MTLMTPTMQCPQCRASLGALAGSVLTCGTCGESYECVDGVWRFLPAARAAHFERFLADYTAVRMAEGRGSADPQYYRRLPEPTAGDPLAWQWAMRARTWSFMARRCVPSWPPDAVVVDLGAGMGWLSNRVAELGCRAVAVDLSVDDRDGLVATRHLGGSWPRLQAEFDRLPLADATADVVVFNASFHYAVDPVVTMHEALRVLRPGGQVVIADSPLYRRDRDGRAMVAERHADFERRFGTRSDSVPSIEYLTRALLQSLAAACGVRWRVRRPWYGWHWALRPWKARLHRRRAPSRFRLLIARRT